MGHKAKGCAGLGHRFLEEQQLPAEKGERELVMGQIQTSSNKLHLCLLPPRRTEFPDLLEDTLSLSWTLSRFPKMNFGKKVEF